MVKISQFLTDLEETELPLENVSDADKSIIVFLSR